MEKVRMVDVLTNGIILQPGARYPVSFKLEPTPSESWYKLFADVWAAQPALPLRRQPRVYAREGRITVEGTTVHEVGVVLTALKPCVKEANNREGATGQRESEEKEGAAAEDATFTEDVDDPIGRLRKLLRDA